MFLKVLKPLLLPRNFQLGSDLVGAGCIDNTASYKLLLLLSNLGLWNQTVGDHLRLGVLQNCHRHQSRVTGDQAYRKVKLLSLKMEMVRTPVTRVSLALVTRPTKGKWLLNLSQLIKCTKLWWQHNLSIWKSCKVPHCKKSPVVLMAQICIRVLSAFLCITFNQSGWPRNAKIFPRSLVICFLFYRS